MRCCSRHALHQRLKDLLALRCACHSLNLASFLFIHAERELKIWFGQHALRLIGPLGNLQTRAGKQISKPSLLKLFWVVEAVEIEMPNGQGLLAKGVSAFMGFNDSVSGAFDAALYAQGLQQIAHEGGFASTQFTV